MNATTLPSTDVGSEPELLRDAIAPVYKPGPGGSVYPNLRSHCDLPGTGDARRARPASRVVAMTTWEYATVPLMIHATKQILDNWGDDGWELVTVLPGTQAADTPAANMNAPVQTNPIAYFKRPKN